MILPIPNGRITAPFSQPRPLGGPTTHIHGAIDVAAPLGSAPNPTAVAPVSGTARCLQFLRPSTDVYWPTSERPDINILLARNYFYDLYGGVITIYAADGTFHILTHFYASQLWAHSAPTYIESRAPGRFPCIALVGDPFRVSEGQSLVPVGNAGFSTGHHIHWEIHPGQRQIYDYADRLDPEKLLGATHV